MRISLLDMGTVACLILLSVLFFSFFFLLVDPQRLSALPVLGLGGAVVGNISARDLRNLIIDSRLFAMLTKPVRCVACRIAHWNSVIL